MIFIYLRYKNYICQSHKKFIIDNITILKNLKMKLNNKYGNLSRKGFGMYGPINDLFDIESGKSRNLDPETGSGSNKSGSDDARDGVEVEDVNSDSSISNVHGCNEDSNCTAKVIEDMFASIQSDFLESAPDSDAIAKWMQVMKRMTLPRGFFAQADWLR